MMDHEIMQGPRETDEQRLARSPGVLRSYADDFDRHLDWQPDHGLPELLRFVADQLDRKASKEFAAILTAHRGEDGPSAEDLLDAMTEAVDSLENSARACDARGQHPAARNERATAARLRGMMGGEVAG
jgi:hypothetical protein